MNKLIVGISIAVVGTGGTVTTAYFSRGFFKSSEEKVNEPNEESSEPAQQNGKTPQQNRSTEETPSGTP